MSILVIYFFSIIVPFSIVEPEGLKVGDRAPDFVMKDQSGRIIKLSDTLKEGKVILTFYRGAWCQYCMKQMKDYQDSLHMVIDAGAKIIAVSPEHESGIRNTVEKTGVAFPLIHDKDLQIMLDYGVITKEKVDEYRELSKQTDEDISRKFVPVPALYIINQEGRIEFVSFNPDYKERMTVEQILANLE